MKKKGFTLIELLAVIVILAVIALIATPAVLGIIEDSKKSAAEASARNIASAAKAYYMSNLMNNISTGTIDLSNSSFKYDGEQATKGYLTYDTKGNVTGKMYVRGYCIEITSDGITSEKIDEDDCSIEAPVSKFYANGTAVYFNPVTNTKCSSSEAVSTTGTKEGCMKWYTFLDSENSSTVKLLLDHNTTVSVAFSSDGNNANGSVSANKQLVTDTTSWNEKVKTTARLISAQEVANITGNNNWNASSTDYYLHNNSNVEYKGAAGTNNFGWLFDNLDQLLLSDDIYYSCTDYGCNSNVNKTSSGTFPSAYWTQTAYTGDRYSYAYAWTIYCKGALSIFSSDNSVNKYVGIRPVITVNKNLLN